VLVEETTVAIHYSDELKANQEAVLAHEIGSRAGRTHHQVELCVIVSLASDDGFQLDFDIRVSRLS